MTLPPAPAITSRRHPAIHHGRDVRDGRDQTLLFAEGPKLVEELLLSPLVIKKFFFTQSVAFETNALITEMRSRDAEGFRVEDDVMAYLSDLNSPPGLVALAERPAPSPADWEKPAGNPLYLALDGLQLPSNVGAVLRSAEAVGVRGVLSGKGGADPLGPKSIRASAGSAFRVPVFSNQDLAKWVWIWEKAGISCVAADPRGEMVYTEWDWTKPVCLILGAEGGGLSLPNETVRRLRIPMEKEVESLNVSVTAGILLYEAVRQRETPKKTPSPPAPLPHAKEGGRSKARKKIKP